MASWDPSAIKPEKQRQQDKENDAHLEQALDSIQLSNFWSDPEYPMFVIKGPQLPPSYYPSSWSRDLHQLIPVNEFIPLLQLVLMGTNASLKRACVTGTESEGERLSKDFVEYIGPRSRAHPVRKCGYYIIIILCLLRYKNESVPLTFPLFD